MARRTWLRMVGPITLVRAPVEFTPETVGFTRYVATSYDGCMDQEVFVHDDDGWLNLSEMRQIHAIALSYLVENAARAVLQGGR